MSEDFDPATRIIIIRWPPGEDVSVDHTGLADWEAHAALERAVAIVEAAWDAAESAAQEEGA